MKTNMKTRPTTTTIQLAVVALAWIYISAASAQLSIPSDGSDGEFHPIESIVVDLSQAVAGNWDDDNSANAGNEQLALAAHLRVDRIEFYTGPYADRFGTSEEDGTLAAFVDDGEFASADLPITTILWTTWGVTLLGLCVLGAWARLACGRSQPIAEA